MQRIFLGAILSVLLSVAAAQSLDVSSATVVAEGLNSPMGLMVDGEGNLWIVDSGVGGDQTVEITGPDGQTMAARVGDTSRVVRVDADGTQTDVGMLPSMMMGEEASGASRIAMAGGNVYVTSGGWIEVPGADPLPKTAAIVRIDDGATTQVADLWAFENEHNPDGFVKEAHPYGLAAAADGTLLVADAGANALLRVDPATGEVRLVAVFEGVPGMFPNDFRGGAVENDPVPTGVTVAADGTIYVSFLPGFPPLPGSAKIVRVTPEGDVADYATGLNILTDVQAAPDGNLYAVQMADFGEQGPVPNSGRVFRIGAGGTVTEVIAGLSFPTAIALAANGDAYVTVNGFGAPGAGQVVRFDGLAAGR